MQTDLLDPKRSGETTPRRRTNVLPRTQPGTSGCSICTPKWRRKIRRCRVLTGGFSEWASPQAQRPERLLVSSIATPARIPAAANPPSKPGPLARTYSSRLGRDCCPLAAGERRSYQPAAGLRSPHLKAGIRQQPVSTAAVWFTR